MVIIAKKENQSRVKGQTLQANREFEIGLRGVGLLRRRLSLACRKRGHKPLGYQGKSTPGRGNSESKYSKRGGLGTLRRQGLRARVRRPARRVRGNEGQLEVSFSTSQLICE